jgi:hypothetical protein
MAHFLVCGLRVLCFSLVVVVGFFVCAPFFGVCCGLVFCVGLWFGFSLVVVVVVGALFSTWLRENRQDV